MPPLLTARSTSIAAPSSAGGSGGDPDASLRHAVLAVEKLRHHVAGVLVRVPWPVDGRMIDLAAGLRTLGGMR